MNITEIRDDLANLMDLVEVCRLALLFRESKIPAIDCSTIMAGIKNRESIANTLHFYVQKQIKILDENLAENK